MFVNLSDHNSNTIFPNPQYYALKKGKQLLTTPDDINITLSSYSVMFQNISRANSGNYSMTIRNYELDSSKEVGTFTSMFEVDVLCEFCLLNFKIKGHYYFSYEILDGPQIVPGVKKLYVLSGDPVSLICGYNLDSNPRANITWMNPQNQPVNTGGSFVLDDGPMVVQLNISSASSGDSGTWICRVDVIAECVHKVIGSSKFKQDCQAITHIGGKNISIELVIAGKFNS